MTDVLDQDLLSPAELLPQASEPEKPAEPLVHECPECGAKKSKLGVPFLTLGQVNTHRQAKHGYRNPNNKTPAKKPAAKKAAPQKAAARSAPARTARKPLGESLARLILQVGRIVNTAVDPPTGAAIMFEAGALGEAVDRVIAGTFIDKPLQKGAAVAEKFEPLVPLVTMPAMIFICSKNPAMSDALEGELREALEDVLVQSLPLLRRRAARTKATVDAVAELKMIDPALRDSADPILDILNGFFSQAAPQAEPDAGSD